MPAAITLTTDFGSRDAYAAQLKGVLLARCPGAAVLDLTHDVAAHDTIEGALFLAAAVPAFPPGTVHLAVVDPGVGGARRAIACAIGGQFAVCPDNGLLTLLARRLPVGEAREIANPALRREPVSATFEGRDVFAPAAAHLACGGALAGLGPPAGGLAALALPEPSREAGGVRGEVLHVDRFGNAITNVEASMLPAPMPPEAAGGVRVRAGGRDLPLRRTYADAAPGEALALVGSGGRLEIAVREGSAADRLGLRRGSPVRVSVPNATN